MPTVASRNRAVASRNRELKSVDEESVYSEDEEGMVSDMDVFVVSSADEDDDIQLCTCVGRAHARTCTFNPRNRGAAASKTDMALSSTLNPPLAQELGLAVDCHH